MLLTSFIYVRFCILCLLTPSIKAKLGCKTTITWNGLREMQETLCRLCLWRSTGRVVVAHRKVHTLCSLMQGLPQRVKPLERVAHTHLCVFQMFSKIRSSVLTLFDQVTFTVYSPVSSAWIHHMQRLISKGLDLMLLRQQGTCLVPHSWLPATGNNSKPQQNWWLQKQVKWGPISWRDCNTPSVMSHSTTLTFNASLSIWYQRQKMEAGVTVEGALLTHISISITADNSWVWTATMWNSAEARLSSVTRHTFASHQAPSCHSSGVSRENVCPENMLGCLLLDGRGAPPPRHSLWTTP